MANLILWGEKDIFNTFLVLELEHLKEQTL